MKTPAMTADGRQATDGRQVHRAAGRHGRHQAFAAFGPSQPAG